MTDSVTTAQNQGLFSVIGNAIGNAATSVYQTITGTRPVAPTISPNTLNSPQSLTNAGFNVSPNPSVPNTYNIYTGGSSGGYTGGVTYAQPSAQSITQSAQQQIAQQSAQQQAAQVQNIISGGGSAAQLQNYLASQNLGSSAALSQAATAAQGIYVNQPSAAVQIGNVGYTGDVYIPQLKMTANQYQEKIKKEAVKEGLVKPEDINYYTYQIENNPLLATDNVSSSLNPSTPTIIQPSGVVGLPKTIPQQLAQNIKDYGLLTGTLRTIGTQSVTAAKNLGLITPSYQTKGLTNFFYEAPQIAPYFTPAGSALLIGTGAESLLSPMGKVNIAIQKQNLASQGYSPIAADILSYAPTAVQIGLGALGIKSQVSSALTKAETPQTQFFATIQRGADEGFSKVNVFAKTNQGNARPVFSIGKETIMNPTEQGFVGYGGGYNIQVEPVYNPITNQINERLISKTPYASIGGGKELGSAARITTLYDINGNPIVVRNPMGEGSLTLSKTGTYNAKGKLVTTEGTNVFTAYPLPDQSSLIVGGQPELLKGGSPRVYFNPETKTLSYRLEKPTITGQIKEIIPQGEQGVQILTPANIKKTPLSATFQEQKAATSLASAAQKSAQETIAQNLKNTNLFYKGTSAAASTKNIPSSNILVGDTGLSSAYVGANKYERTTGGLTPPTSENLLAQEQSYNLKVIPNLKIQEGQQIKQVQNLSLLQPDPVLSTQSSISVQQQPQPQRELLNQIAPPIEKQAQVSQTLSASEQANISQQQQEKIRKKLMNIRLSGKNNIISKVIRRKKEFLAITKRKGKEVVLGRYENPLQAEAISANVSRRTLARSIIVRSAETGQRIPLVPAQGFRPSKINPNQLVQSNALSSRSETVEIQAAKKARKPFFKPRKVRRARI